MRDCTDDESRVACEAMSGYWGVLCVAMSAGLMIQGQVWLGVAMLALTAVGILVGARAIGRYRDGR